MHLEPCSPAEAFRPRPGRGQHSAAEVMSHEVDLCLVNCLPKVTLIFFSTDTRPHLLPPRCSLARRCALLPHVRGRHLHLPVRKSTTF